MNLDLVNLLLICVVELSIPMAYVEGSLLCLVRALLCIGELLNSRLTTINTLVCLEYPSGFL